MVRACIDEEEFKALDYWQQWDGLVRLVFHVGGRPTLPASFLHLLWSLSQVGIFYGLARWTCPGHLDFGAVLLRALFMGHWLFEFLSWTGMFSGPMWGHLNPPFPWTAMRFKRGTMKEPLFAFLGSKRNIFDVAMAWFTTFVMLGLLLTPEAGKWDLLWPLCVWSYFVLDFGCYTGSFGVWYGPVSLLYGLKAAWGPAGFLAGLQIVLLVTWIFSGLGKHGKWWRATFAAEWVLPTICSLMPCLKKVMYEDLANDDYRPSTAASLLSFVAAALEWTAPVLLLLTPQLGPLAAYAGLFVLLSMHVYIVFHFPIVDVNMINLVPIFWSWRVFFIEHVGFDYGDLLAMPVVLKALVALLLAQTVAGHIRTDIFCYINSFRFWTGNNAFSWFVLSDSAVQKISEGVVSTAEFPPQEALRKSGLMTPWECDFLPCFVLGAVWTNIPSQRILPALLRHVAKGRPLHELTVIPGFALVNHCFGSASNDDVRNDALLRVLRDSVQFEEGEVVVIRCGCASSFGEKMPFSILDLKAGQLMAGSWTMNDALAVRRPSDYEAVQKLLPLSAQG